jgi:diguanylate cyclase (GGDEF)-like protein
MLHAAHTPTVGGLNLGHFRHALSLVQSPHVGVASELHTGQGSNFGEEGVKLLEGIAKGRGALSQFLQCHSLHCVFQPVVRLSDGQVFAHEALVRGPAGTSFSSPDAIFLAAQNENITREMESLCLVIAIRSWVAQQRHGRLFLNISANALIKANQSGQIHLWLDLATRLGLQARRIVLEITEHERVENMDELEQVASAIRIRGVGLALDDFGDGRSSLRLWSQVKPEFVKTDKYFCLGVHCSAEKLKTMQALQQIASIFGTQLICEGVEASEDLRILRDLGINFAQGYFLSAPCAQIQDVIAPEAAAILIQNRAAVFPELTRTSFGSHLRSVSVIPAPTVEPATTNDKLATIFMAHPRLHAVAMLQHDAPVGIINRNAFMNEYSRIYYREVWGRKPCMMHVNRSPRLVERIHNVDELIGILTSEDQRYLQDGFIVTENGRYVGIGAGDELVRSVTETRIEAARHANPLTFLPGNIPITQHIDRLLHCGASFVACYADLNHFKPFNDQYGYWRGDEMIRLFARVAQTKCDTQADFLGHVGGDDFVILFQTVDWQERCLQMIASFNAQAQELFDPQARQRGGIVAEDRFGVQRFFTMTTVSIGCVCIAAKQFTRAEEVASKAASAKHRAKESGQGLHVLT